MIVGINGHGTMGMYVESICINENLDVKIIDISKDNALENVDVVIDFSHPNKVDKLLQILKTKPTNCVIATTNLSLEQLKNIENLSNEMAICQTYNTSIGVNAMFKLVSQMAKIFEEYDVEILEKHHNKKVDAPSGTAIKLFDSIKQTRPNANVVQNQVKRTSKDNINVSVMRMGAIVGEHSVFFGNDEEIVEIKHQALSKKLFAKGAIDIARKIQNKQKGLFTVNDLLGE